MDDGLVMAATFPQSPGHDISPEEMGRHFRATPRQRHAPVGAILNLNDYVQEGIRNTPLYLQNSRDHLVEEPLDIGPIPTDEIVLEAEDVMRDDGRFMISDGDFQKYYDERERLKTYGQWKQTYHVTHLDLARNGFVFLGPKDRVVCVFCRKTIYQWEEGDRVEEEHRRFSPMCPFVRGECNEVNRPISVSAILKSQFEIMLKSRTVEYPSYADPQTRKDTYVNWPRPDEQRAETLTKAGFFYTGRADCVTCFQCGTTFSQWRRGECPTTVHVRKNPLCPFVSSLRTSTPN